jgi:2-polyprenyl-3-methyl-5-hydroxy-6-metoxy-1,4-benzoquinol methylase
MIGADMNVQDPATQYALGNTDAEHERLTQQAAQFDPLTERLFRAAGVGPGQRVVELGSGAGDVAMLVARIVGPSGEVVGVERNQDSIAYATARVAKAGLNNVRFTQSDVGQIKEDKPFDAAVGRFILQFLPDPAAVLRSLTRLVRPGGGMAFHEVYLDLSLSVASHLTLTFAARSLAEETIRRSGSNTSIGISLREVFHNAGLPAPSMHLDMPLSNERDFAIEQVARLESLRPRFDASDPRLAILGDFKTLAQRLIDEIAAANAPVPWLATVSAWARIPQ